MTTMLSEDRVRRGQELLQAVRDGAGQVLLGQRELIDLCLIALCARGHLLLEGLPGLGKTRAREGPREAVCARAERASHPVHARPAPRAT